ncbi:uncharacterized protein [Nothobranchius furzeri]|uniref:uncharacterized protein isoform X2 n=1 Tax=Nothobranchius furzeri TaxID=105023 RepID=UPI003904D764
MSESSGQAANPADSPLADLLNRLSQQEQALPLLMEQLQAANDRFQQLEAMVREVQLRLSQPPPQAPAAEPPPAAPVSPAVPGPAAAAPPEVSYFRPASSPPTPTFSENRNDVGDRELLAVKLAIEEWRHWLEGAETPFVIWTDHKNLVYLREAKRLNPRHYRLYAPDQEVEASTILPPACVVGGVTWEIQDQVLEAFKTDPGPGKGLPGRLYVPQGLRGKVIRWAHTGRFSLHPGADRTIALLKRTFWWPAMYKDVKDSMPRVCPTEGGPSASSRFIKPPSSSLTPLVTHSPGFRLRVT